MENSIINTVTDKVTEVLNSPILQENAYPNVGQTERIISIGSGAFIALKGISNLFSHPLLALTEIGLGGALLYRGITAYCPIKEKLDEREFANSTRSEPYYSSPTVPARGVPYEAY